MSEHYQQLDGPHFDYALTAVPGIDGHRFRGPLPPLDAPFIACIGGAQTFGRFAVDPYPAQLSRALGVPCLNLGLGGAGPRFALSPPVLQLLARARLVVVQMFSGRSASNALFDNTDGRNFGRVVGTDAWMSFEQFLEELMQRADRPLLERTVAETRDDYTFAMESLARAIPAPKVLLWLSRRRPAYRIDWSTPWGVLAHYPQLVDQDVVDRLKPGHDAYVECVGEAGLPQRLWPSEVAVDGTQRGADGWLENRYYPPPELHEQCAELLLGPCRELLVQRR